MLDRHNVIEKGPQKMNGKLSYIALTFALFIALSFAFERRAYAYIDPGTNLLLLQNIGAAVAGGLFYFRRRLKNLLSRSPLERNSSDEQPR